MSLQGTRLYRKGKADHFFKCKASIHWILEEGKRNNRNIILIVMLGGCSSNEKAMAFCPQKMGTERECWRKFFKSLHVCSEYLTAVLWRITLWQESWVLCLKLCSPLPSNYYFFPPTYYVEVLTPSQNLRIYSYLEIEALQLYLVNMMRSYWSRMSLQSNMISIFAKKKGGGGGVGHRHAYIQTCTHACTHRMSYKYEEKIGVMCP